MRTPQNLLESVRESPSFWNGRDCHQGRLPSAEAVAARNAEETHELELVPVDRTDGTREHLRTH